MNAIKNFVFTIFIALLFDKQTWAQQFDHEEPCSDTLCGPIVSKCLLTRSCSCDQQDIKCYKECFHCLNQLFDQCCSCVAMCPKPEHLEMDMSDTSHVEDLPKTYPELFQVLTEEQDELQRWLSFTFPVQTNSNSDSLSVSSKDSDHSSKNVNCTVAYMSQCMSWNKCRSSCSSMGATSYRWFHDGCCECVGDECINYGLNESKCLNCPTLKDESESSRR